MTDRSSGVPTSSSPARRSTTKLALHALLFALSLAMVYPLLWMMAGSFRSNGEILNNLSVIPDNLDPRN